MKWLFFALGWVFFVLGLVGVFIPLLPTTPFIILAASCFSKSSDRFYNWLLELPVMGPPLKDWKNYRVIRLKSKILATALIVSAIGYVGIFSEAIALIKLAMLLVCGLVLTYIWMQKSVKSC